MNKSEQAVDVFKNGYNCSQSVFSVFSEELGLKEKKAAGIAAVFGGGMAHTQETCGAVTGAMMVLGMKYFDPEAPQESKAVCYDKGQEFINLFKREKKSIICRELLGTDFAGATEKGLFHTVCADLVKTAARILEESF